MEETMKKVRWLVWDALGWFSENFLWLMIAAGFVFLAITIVNSPKMDAPLLRLMEMTSAALICAALIVMDLDYCMVYSPIKLTLARTFILLTTIVVAGYGLHTESEVVRKLLLIWPTFVVIGGMVMGIDYTHLKWTDAREKKQQAKQKKAAEAYYFRHD
jgi:hypothetical protein